MVEPSDELWFYIHLGCEETFHIVPYLVHTPHLVGTVSIGPFFLCTESGGRCSYLHYAGRQRAPDHIQTEAFLYLSSQMRKRVGDALLQPPQDNAG